MGRPERPVDVSAGPVAEFAAQLRTLRRKAGNPPYRQLARHSQYSVTTLSDAAGGKRLPSLDVTLAYVAACDGDREQWEQAWKALKAELAEAEDRTEPTAVTSGARPQPSQVTSEPLPSPHPTHPDATPDRVGVTGDAAAATGAGGARAGRRTLWVVAVLALVAGAALGTAGTVALRLPDGSGDQASDGGDPSATPSAWRNIAPRTTSTAHPSDGMDPVRTGCGDAHAQKYITNLDSVPVYLPDGSKFGELRMRSNPHCSALNWGVVYGPVRPNRKVYVIAYRPADRAKSISWYGGAYSSAYGWMLSTNPGCVYIEAYVQTPNGNGPTARTQCL